eukprot:PhF_6_TR28096/c0_g1_i3/m.41539/K07904/RAB11A; Ras-related protein Rab-11A
MEGEVDAILKVLLLGDYAVGKTSTTLRFTTDKFEVRVTPTIGVDFYAKTVSRISRQGLNMVNTRVRVQIWDTAGQEKYRSTNKTIYRGAAAVILMYDITSRRSFESIGEWLKSVRDTVYGHDDPVFMLIGNKSDLDHDREVQTDEAKKFAEDNKIAFLETSAKSGENVARAFDDIVGTLITKLDIRPNWDEKKKSSQQQTPARGESGFQNASPEPEEEEGAGQKTPPRKASAASTKESSGAKGPSTTSPRQIETARKLPNQSIILKEDPKASTTTGQPTSTSGGPAPPPEKKQGGCKC